VTTRAEGDPTTAQTSGGPTATQSGDAPPAVVAVVASAGGVEALTSFVSMLPAGFPAAVLVVLHIPAASPSVLPRILARAGRLPARHPADGEPLARGVIAVAPPDRHLVVAGRHIRLLSGARENGHRPSADVLLRSVAEVFGDRAAGVVLSGTMDDGAAGLRAIAAVSGLTLVQDPEEASFPGMPLAAIAEASPQFVGPVTALAGQVCNWVARLPGHPGGTGSPAGGPPDDPFDPPLRTSLTCPECGGSLFPHDLYGASRVRCRVGRTYSLNGLSVGKQEVLEKALWAAVVALDEQAEVARRILKRLGSSGRIAQRQRYQEEVTLAEQRSAALTGLIRELTAQTSREETRHYE
jgi:two-component system chemotaxis response regulator CheB